jgi:hypothetical protein
MVNKNSIYIGALTSFILDTKPYHSKLTEIQEVYQFFDELAVKVDERLFSTVLTKAAWPYSFFSDGQPELSPGLGKPMPLHHLAHPLIRAHAKNSDVTETRGAFKAYRDENTDLPAVPLAFDPKCLQGSGLSDAFVQRLGLKAFNEPLLEGHDVYLSNGAYVFQIKQALSTQPIVVGRFNEVYEITDGPFPLLVSLPFSNADSLVIIGPATQVTLGSISIDGPGQVTVSGLSSGPNYSPKFTERQNEGLLTEVTYNTQANALDVGNPASAVNRVGALLSQIEAQLAITPDTNASAELAALQVLVATPTLPSSYEALLNALIAASTPVLAGYAGWRGQDITIPYTDRYVDQTFAELSPALYFNSYIDLNQREDGSLGYADVHVGVLSITNVATDPIYQDYEEWTLVAVTATRLIISGNLSGSIGLVEVGSTFSSTKLAFSVSATGALTPGDTFKLTPRAKITVHYQAPLEAWSLISTNPLAYSRPLLASTRYGYLVSAAAVPNFVTLLDSSMQSTTIVLTATSSSTFTLSSTTEPMYTGLVTVNAAFNDGRLAFTVIAGSAYAFTPGDKFHIEIENSAAVAEDLDMYYGYDLDSYDAENLVFNNVNALAANYLEQIGFGYDSRFVGYDLNTFGLVLDPAAIGARHWRLRALPNALYPLLLQDGSPAQVSVIATDNPLDPFALTQFDMANDVTSEGTHSANDPDTVFDLKLFYSTSFELEFCDDLEVSAWSSVGIIPVGVPYTNSTHGLSFTIAQGAKPFIAGELSSSAYTTTSGAYSEYQTIGGDVISWTVQNPPPVQIGPASISGRNTPRLIMYGSSYYGATPARWVLTWTGMNVYQLQGIYTAGSLIGQSVFVTPITVNTADGRSFRSREHNIHFTVVQGLVGLSLGDSFSFETYSNAPTFLVHGSVSGWQQNATVGEWYWNGKIGFKIPAATVACFDYNSVEIAGTSSWMTAYGLVTLDDIRPNAPSCTYTAVSHTPGHWTLYRDGNVVNDGNTVLRDEYIALTMPTSVSGFPKPTLKFRVDGHEYALVQGNDLAVIRTTDSRTPTADDFVLLERTEFDALQISIKARDPVHQVVLDELAPNVTDLRFVDHNANSGVPLSVTSPETAVTTGWLPIIETWFDRPLSLAEFSDAATHVEVRAAATGEIVGTVESLSVDPSYPVVFRWDPTFHAKYLPLNTEAMVVTLGSGMDERVNVQMRDNATFLISGGGLADNMLFADLLTVAIAEDPQWLIRTSIDDVMAAIMADGPFGGFLPGYDNMELDFETGAGNVNDEDSPDGYYDAGVPFTDYFLQAQSLALLPSMTAPQQALHNDLISRLYPYLDNGDITTTTLTEFLTNIGANPPALPVFNDLINWTPVGNGFGIPAVGMGMDIAQNPEGAVGTAMVEAMSVLSTDEDCPGPYEFDTGDMDACSESTIILLLPDLPPCITPLMINTAGARVIVLSFAVPILIIPLVHVVWPNESFPTLAPIVQRLSPMKFMFSIPREEELKLIIGSCGVVIPATTLNGSMAALAFTGSSRTSTTSSLNGSLTSLAFTGSAQTPAATSLGGAINSMSFVGAVATLATASLGGAIDSMSFTGSASTPAAASLSGAIDSISFTGSAETPVTTASLNGAIDSMSFTGSTQAPVYRPFYGVDPNGLEVPLTIHPNSDAARAAWGVFCTPLAEEDFEGFAANTDMPVLATMGSVTGLFELTVLGTNEAIQVKENVPGNTNTVGRYSLPSATSSKFLQGVCYRVGSGNGFLKLTFSVPVKGFGIWCTDLGDFAGSMTVEYYDVSDNLIYSQPLNTTTYTQSWYNAAVSFVGLVADGGAVKIKSILFKATAATGDGDYFGLDRLTVALV